MKDRFRNRFLNENIVLSKFWSKFCEPYKDTILWLGNNKTVESSLEAQESMHFAPGFLSLNTGRFKVCFGDSQNRFNFLKIILASICRHVYRFEWWKNCLLAELLFFYWTPEYCSLNWFETRNQFFSSFYLNFCFAALQSQFKISAINLSPLFFFEIKIFLSKCLMVFSKQVS